VARAAALILALLAGSASAGGFKPFTKVDSVCEKCTSGPAWDHVTLKSGQEVAATIIAENDDFLVLEHFGELRAARRDEIATVTKNPAAVRPPGFTDQLLLTDGTVRAGTLTGDPAADMIEMNVPGTPAPQHHIAKVAVAAVYKAGKKL
jgi:hypothetical protein